MAARSHNIGPPFKHQLWSGVSFVVGNRGTVLLQLIGLHPSVLVAMQMYGKAKLAQGFYSVKHINYTTIVGRVRYIERNDVHVFHRSIAKSRLSNQS